MINDSNVRLSISTNGFTHAAEDSCLASPSSAPPNTPVSPIFDVSGKFGTMSPPTSVYDFTNHLQVGGYMSDSSFDDSDMSFESLLASLSVVRALSGSNGEDSDWDLDDDFNYLDNTSSSLGELPIHIKEETVFDRGTHTVVRTVIRPNKAATYFDFTASCPESPVPGSPIRPSSPACDLTHGSTGLEDSAGGPVISEKCLDELQARLHFEEDLDYREHQWLLERATCGRTEVWVETVTTSTVVERVQKPEVTHGRPRVFSRPSPKA